MKISDLDAMRVRLLMTREQQLAAEIRAAQATLAREREDLVRLLAITYELAEGDQVSVLPDTFGEILRAADVTPTPPAPV